MARTALLTTLAMLAFAGNSLLCRLALRDTGIDAASFTAIRLGSGALILAAILLARGMRPAAGGSWPMAAMLFAYAVCFSFAYRDLTAATGALLLFGAVQFTMTGYGLWTGERVRGLRLADQRRAAFRAQQSLRALRDPPLAVADYHAWLIGTDHGNRKRTAQTGGCFTNCGKQIIAF